MSRGRAWSREGDVHLGWRSQCWGQGERRSSGSREPGKKAAVEPKSSLRASNLLWPVELWKQAGTNQPFSHEQLTCKEEEHVLGQRLHSPQGHHSIRGLRGLQESLTGIQDTWGKQTGILEVKTSFSK